MKRLILLALSAALLLAGCVPAQQKAQDKQYTATFLDLFDTVTTIVGRAESEEAFTLKAQAVHDALEEYHRLFDIYNDYEGVANLKSVNDNAGVAPVQVDEKIIRLLRDTILNPDHEIQSPVIRSDGNGTLLSDGLVDEIGMQGHVDTALDIGQYISSMRVYSDLTGLVHVTELDMMNNAYPDTEKPALVYKELFKAFIKAVQEDIRLGSVTIWGLTDDRSWRKEKQASLLFDAQSRPKKEFYAVAEAVKDAQ